jgi:hypothetical protein
MGSHGSCRRLEWILISQQMNWELVLFQADNAKVLAQYDAFCAYI